MSSDHKRQGDVLDAVKVQRPRQYKVIILNDDYTTMDFVVDILINIFSHSYETAFALMLKVHKQGSGVAGLYSLQIAEAKVNEVHARARKEGFPLKCLIEPVEAKEE